MTEYNDNGRTKTTLSKRRSVRKWVKMGLGHNTAKATLAPTGLGVTVKAVETRREADDFVGVPYLIYANNPYYVPDMESDIRETLAQSDGSASLEECDVKAFIAYNADRKAVGRIVGIINHRANKKWNTQTVRFGLIEFIDDARVSSALVEAVSQWGAAKGMTKIQGPMGIFDFDKEGMLVEDFDQTGSFISIYNPPYYPKHLDAMGFKKAVDWVQIRVDVPKSIPAKYSRVAQLSKEMFGLKVRKLTRTGIRRDGDGQKVFRLLNQAYSPLFGYTELSDKQIDEFVDRYMPLIDLRMVPVVENAEGEMIGVAITMGSLSKALQKAQGRLLPFGWVHLLNALKFKHEEKAEMLLVAVRPDYQGLGINALFFNDLIPIYNQLGYTWAETGPQLESNVRELSQWKPLNPTLTKRRRCYEKEIH